MVIELLRWQRQLRRDHRKEDSKEMGGLSAQMQEVRWFLNETNQEPKINQVWTSHSSINQRHRERVKEARLRCEKGHLIEISKLLNFWASTASWLMIYHKSLREAILQEFQKDQRNQRSHIGAVLKMNLLKVKKTRSQRKSKMKESMKQMRKRKLLRRQHQRQQKVFGQS